jgi:uroporphyrinogen decarboxylase
MALRTLSHRERLEACLAGEEPDRTPIALWRHFPVDDQTPEGLAVATAAFQRSYDFDLIKVTPPSSFCLKDWGSDDQWTGSVEGTREYQRFVIQRPEDWPRLPILNPQQGKLGAQLNCLRILITEFSPQIPVVQTVFSPLAQAKNLVGGDELLIHLRQNPEELHAGLEKITRSTILFLEELRKSGVDGIFYAIQHAQYGLLSETEFQKFARAYDLKVLEAARSMWLNIGHIHGENIMFDQVIDYPVAVLNWHDQHTSPSLSEAAQKFKGVLCGGLRRWETMVLGTPIQVQTEAREAIQATQGKRFILGTGCVMPIITPHGNILAARESVTQEGIL